MSSALASAKRKRAIPEPTPQVKPGLGRAFTPGASLPNGSQYSPLAAAAPTGPITIPQAFGLLDKRVKVLEEFMGDSKSGGLSLDGLKIGSSVIQSPQSTADVPSNLTDILDEYNARFDILAEEIANLKNIVLSLQSYTMDVNKTLMEERIRVLGGTESPQIHFEASAAKEMTLEEALANETFL